MSNIHSFKPMKISNPCGLNSSWSDTSNDLKQAPCGGAVLNLHWYNPNENQGGFSSRDGIDNTQSYGEDTKISNEEDDDYDTYIIHANINKKLSQELGLSESIMEDDFSPLYIPPNNYGLENSNVIIPDYYQLHKYPSKIMNINYLKIIEDDIRNFRKLNEYQLNYIKMCSDENKNKIIDVFNECYELLEQLF